MTAEVAKVRLAVLDVDSGFLRVLRNRLEGVGWQLRVLASPVPIDAIASMRLHALVVDLAGTYLERVCTQLPDVAIVVCTGRSSVAQRVRGLRLGADDWVTKPCHPVELIARVEAIVRRRDEARATPEPRRAVVKGEIEIRPDRFEVFVDSRPADLTRREFELVEMLANAEGQVLERDEIYREVWGYSLPRGDRSVDVFVRKVRAKLELLSPDWRYIHTHFGIGYRFAPESLQPVQPVLAGDSFTGREHLRNQRLPSVG